MVQFHARIIHLINATAGNRRAIGKGRGFYSFENCQEHQVIFSLQKEIECLFEDQGIGCRGFELLVPSVLRGPVMQIGANASN
jgi:hypothetical protein